ncbi:Uncharacterized protein BP5553_02304 [Venustampulla echinocandica]|uniref:Major facilitator superfamily (MFS) profile domain-containing protein n=1 Tax=Venustampulla echinocandica TaxID=2656787 RepID=A0A370U3H9_9HELO|nr:Uncharacterized protein BP5553_02304 [Venustampulla echinocandica]RDL42325.1 Uncharacterized protein BP5553_02304 [Venustampulla echinocandica]
MDIHRETVIGGPGKEGNCSCSGSGSCTCGRSLTDVASPGVAHERPSTVQNEIDKHQQEPQPQQQKEREGDLTADENAIVPIDVDDSSVPSAPPVYIKGWRLYMLGAGVWISLFLSTLETTIVSTSLVSITDAIHGFAMRDWIVTAYLITYTGFLVIFAKFSDIFGKKTMFLLALAIFTLFSILCGAAEGIVELIIFRAFQGMGASGIYSLIMVIAPTLVPPETFGSAIAVISSVFLLASVLGPILGGVISEHGGGTWRWVFLLNAPGGGLALLLLTFFLPSSISATGTTDFCTHLRSKFSKAAWSRVDVLGTVLLLAFSVLLVFALEEAGSRYPWSSPVIVVTIIFATISGMAFIVWEWLVEKRGKEKRGRQEPTFPLSLLKGRVMAAMMATAFFIGFPFVAIIVNIPQRAQAVYDVSSSEAGLGLLPLMLSSPFATALSGYLTSSRNVPPVHIILVGAILQVIGVGLTCSLPITATGFPKQLYGFEVIMGLGFGLGLSTLLVLARLVVDEKNLPVTMGAITQVRVLGGTISLGICSTILNNHLRPQLSKLITPEQAHAISENLSAIHTLTPIQQAGIRRVFAEGYNQQNIFLVALTGIGLLTSLLLIEKVPRRVK